ncbi:MAG: hypothetical protein HY805_09340 [Nitrospirae bacterium]|nr:hypothetical protein [Nitrospirota bacterium]
MLKAKLLILFISIGIVGPFRIQAYSAQNEENWELIDETNTESYYYDTKSVVRPSKDIVQAMGKIITESQEKTDLIEINCEFKEFRILYSITHTADGKTIEQESPLEWELIDEESASAILFELLCR